MMEERKDYCGELQELMDYAKDAPTKEISKEESDELTDELKYVGYDKLKRDLSIRHEQLNTGTYYIENSDRHYIVNSVTMLDDDIPVIHLGLGYWMYHDVWKKFNKQSKTTNIRIKIGNNLKQLKHGTRKT